MLSAEALGRQSAQHGSSTHTVLVAPRCRFLSNSPRDRCVPPTMPPWLSANALLCTSHPHTQLHSQLSGPIFPRPPTMFFLVPSSRASASLPPPWNTKCPTVPRPLGAALLAATSPPFAAFHFRIWPTNGTRFPLPSHIHTCQLPSAPPPTAASVFSSPLLSTPSRPQRPFTVLVSLPT